MAYGMTITFGLLEVLTHNIRVYLDSIRYEILQIFSLHRRVLPGQRRGVVFHRPAAHPGEHPRTQQGMGGQHLHDRGGPGALVCKY